MMIKKIRRLSCLIVLFSITSLQAQNFQYKAKVEKTDKDDYFRIKLSPELLGKLNKSYSDIRIYSSGGKEEAYFFIQEEGSAIQSMFKTYEIIDKQYKEDAISHLVFHNPDKKKINNVSFIVKNTDVKKRARLSGSDDRENWYVIKDNYLLHTMQNSEETTELKILNFPLSDYEYFKLEINDNWKLPINILEVGYYDNEEIKGSSTFYDMNIAEVNDSIKSSFIRLKVPEKMYLEKLKLDLSGADFYSREIDISIKEKRIDRKKKKHVSYRSLGTFNLNSNSNNEIDLGRIAVEELYLKIKNNDDQPLQLDKATAIFLNRYAVARLSQDSSYVIMFGNNNIGFPNYDINKFVEKIVPVETILTHGKIEEVKKSENVKREKTGFFESKYFIWTVIVVVGLVLGIISFKMIKEMGNRNDNTFD